MYAVPNNGTVFLSIGAERRLQCGEELTFWGALVLKFESDPLYEGSKRSKEICIRPK